MDTSLPAFRPVAGVKVFVSYLASSTIEEPGPWRITEPSRPLHGSVKRAPDGRERRGTGGTSLGSFMSRRT